ncbi:exodeoxyribonuclease VII large subunit [Burkholderiaceae bacterium DAT-1]|nr:exodeoxyribonuclease VII large subunit [Burkholderiaceae bacterium DAT-1]
MRSERIVMTLSSLDRVVSVSELNRQARLLLESSLPQMWIGGEISNLTVAASGHLYFTLKDAQAQVRSVMFRTRAALLPFRPKEGLKVEARAQISLYEARGDYQLLIEAMRPAGVGALFEAYEKLRLALAQEGLFDAARKRPLPGMSRTIGIVTSPQAAALQDVLSVLRARAPYVRVVLYPVPVQGAGAAEKIAAMIDCAASRAEVDVLLVVRGGGSIEDLWSFNEEIVARAIARCSIPVVSGVGHETDTTITDFVADVRAPTPTAAATLVAPAQLQLQSQLDALKRRMSIAMSRRLGERMQRVDGLARRLISPRQRLMLQRERLKGAQARLERRMMVTLEQQRWRFASLKYRHQACRPHPADSLPMLTQMQQRLIRAHAHMLARLNTRVTHAESRLAGLNPDAVLQRGYAIIHDRKGKVIRGVSDLKSGDAISLRMADGDIAARIDKAAEQGALDF